MGGGPGSKPGSDKPRLSKRGKMTRRSKVAQIEEDEA